MKTNKEGIEHLAYIGAVKELRMDHPGPSTLCNCCATSQRMAPSLTGDGAWPEKALTFQKFGVDISKIPPITRGEGLLIPDRSGNLLLQWDDV